MTGGAHDTLRDELDRALGGPDGESGDYKEEAERLLPVVRQAEARAVAAERERLAAEFDQMGNHPGRVETFADQIWWHAARIARGQP